jgi:hypothetical protein
MRSTMRRKKCGLLPRTDCSFATRQWSIFFDLCAISLPLPRAGALPVGLMLVARNAHDRRLFRMAAAVERLFFSDRRGFLMTMTRLYRSFSSLNVLPAKASNSGAPLLALPQKESVRVA